MPDSHWRNILHHHDEPNEAMQRIDAQVASLEELPDAMRHIRALISRFDSLTSTQPLTTSTYSSAPSARALTRASPPLMC